MPGRLHRRCLVVSPIPTVPANQGNAALIASLNRWLQAAGYAVHFVYSAMEGMDEDAIAAMEREWERVDVIPYAAANGAGSEPDIQLDDWLDPSVVEHVVGLCDVWRFDLVIVHYVWMSGVFGAIPAGIPKWLYTHDRFADRHVMLARAGIAPTWYSISVHEEARGLARADLVLATQETEASYFRSIIEQPVHVLGAPQVLRDRPMRRFGNPDSLVAGYIASSNPGNCRAFKELLNRIDEGPLARSAKFKLILAGPISLLSEFRRPYIESIGIIDDPDDLFVHVDVMINPGIGGSGIKIKTLDSLAAGMPLISTRDGTSGLNASYHALTCTGPEQVADLLISVAHTSMHFKLKAACRQLIESYQRVQCRSQADLLDGVSNRGQPQ